MRLALLLVAALVLAGCFGPYASDLELPPPEPRKVEHVWDYTAGAAEAVPPASVDLKARYSTTGFAGAEPNLGVTSGGALFMTSYDTTIRSQDGSTWQEVYDFAPGLEDGVQTGDPMLWADPATDIVYTNHMYPPLVCFFTAWSADEGESWQENPKSCTLPGVDHQKFFTAEPGPLAPAVAGQDHPTVLYQCYQRYMDPESLGLPELGVPGVGGYTTHCNMSYDGGVNWPAETLAAARLPGSCGGINGHPASAPDGTVVVPITRGCDGLYVSVSQDSGLTWQVRAGPKDVGAESIDADIAFTPDGTMHAVWRGTDHLLYLARSADLGESWDGPWRVSPPHVTSTVFQVIGAGDDGRIAMGFLGTDDGPYDPSTADANATWDLYIVTSEDAGAGTPSLRAVRVNAESDPVQIGCVWLHGGGHPCRNMLDFIDSAVAPDGTFHVAFTKGCDGGCAGKAGADADDSRASATALATLDGWSLYG